MRRGFTLIEITVVMMVIVLLAALVYPVTVRAKGYATRAASISNLRQVYIATHLYKEAHGEWPQGIDPVVEGGYLKSKELLVSVADPVNGYGSSREACEGRTPKHKTSYETMLAWPDHLKKELEKVDANHGIIAARIHGNKTSYFEKGISSFCNFSAFMFEGPLLRLRIDGSVETANYPLRMVKTDGSRREAPLASKWDLYTSHPRAKEED